MKTKKELLIALIVGIVMITIILFIVYGKTLFIPDTSELRIYKLSVIDGVDENDESIPVEEKYEYNECTISQDDKIEVYKQYKKAISFKMEQTKSGATAKGEYKIVMGDDYIAFDNNDKNWVYSSKTNRVHEFNTKMYNIVINACK